MHSERRPCARTRANIHTHKHTNIRARAELYAQCRMVSEKHKRLVEEKKKGKCFAPTRELFSECRLVGENNKRSVCRDLTEKKRDVKAIGECCFLTLMLKVNELIVKYRIRSRLSFVSD